MKMKPKNERYRLHSICTVSQSVSRYNNNNNSNRYTYASTAFTRIHHTHIRMKSKMLAVVTEHSKIKQPERHTENLIRIYYAMSRYTRISHIARTNEEKMT